jgi:drug/metabolite transporter (DMT)-like permease
MTYDAGPPLEPEVVGRRPLPPAARRRLPARFVVLLVLIGVLLVVTGGDSLRTSWAHAIRHGTGGYWPADFVIGAAIGLLPLLGIGVAVLTSRRAKHHALRRAWRMLLLGGAGFVVAYILSPSPLRLLTDHGTTTMFRHVVPGYLPGVYAGVLVWIAVVVVGYTRFRTWLRGRRSVHAERFLDGR